MIDPMTGATIKRDDAAYWSAIAQQGHAMKRHEAQEQRVEARSQQREKKAEARADRDDEAKEKAARMQRHARRP